MKRQQLFSVPLLTSFALLILSSCTEEEKISPNQPLMENPWDEQVNMSLFNINSGSIVTYQDGQSVNILDDYVIENELPDVDFELMGLNAMIPTTENFVTTVTHAKVEMESDLGPTGNIYFDELSKFSKQITYDNVLYSVYEVYGFYNGSVGQIRPSNFNNITFTLIVEYKQNDQVIETRTVTLGIYKRQ